MLVLFADVPNEESPEHETPLLLQLPVSWSVSVVFWNMSYVAVLSLVAAPSGFALRSFATAGPVKAAKGFVLEPALAFGLEVLAGGGVL